MLGNEQDFQQAMNQGHSAAWDQDWAEAADFYKQALDEFPDHPKALTSLALALYQLQEYKSSLNYYQQATKVSPQDPMPQEKAGELHELLGNLDKSLDARMRSAELYVQSKDVNKAIEMWAKVVNQKPDHLMAHSRLALVYEKMQQNQQAMREYLALASIMQLNGEVNKAVQAASRAQQLMPKSQEPVRALTMLQTGERLPRPTRPSAVTSPLKMPSEPQPPSGKSSELTELGKNTVDPISECRKKALAELASLLFEDSSEVEDVVSGRRGGLQALMDGVGMGGGDKQIDQTKVLLHLSQAIDLQSKGKNGAALDELQRAVDSGLDHPAAHFDLSLLLWEADRLEPAIKHLQRVVAHADYMLGARLLMGQVYANMGKAQEAAVQMLEALKLADALLVPQAQRDALRRAYDPLIEAQMHQKDDENQVRLYNNVRELLIRSNWKDQLASAREQLPASDTSAPMPLADILTEGSSSQLVELITLINQLARMGYYRTAMEEAYYALISSPEYLPLHATMGDILLRQDNVPAAIVKFKIVSHSYSTRGEPLRAIASYQRVLDLSPMDMTARQHLIDLYIAHGQLSQAVDEYLSLADSCYSLADLNSARKACEDALRVAQTAGDKLLQVKVLHQMADIDLQSLDWRQALKTYEQIRQVDAGDDRARGALVELNLRLGRTAQAIKELDSFVGAALKAGKREPLIQLLENLIENNPKQPVLNRRLAELYRQANRVDEAIAQLDLAGEMFLEAGNKNAAAEAITALIALNPDQAEDYRQLLSEIQA